ncbi:MAG: glutathione-regulated potassium-efflux system protein KefC, partial [Myxococcales bacterium]
LLPLGLPWRAALVGGLALGLSSTAVAMQTMNERNLSPTPLGRTAFGIPLFQDLAAIPLLALVPLLSDAAVDGAPPAWRKGLVALGAVVAVVVVGGLVTPRLLRLIARTGLREVFTATTLLIVIGIAQIMHAADVSMALGSFVAGVLLAGSEYRHALESDLEPFKGLLMGLFFIAVGMSIDFGLLATRPLLVAALVVGFQVIKGLALRGIAPGLQVASPQRWLFAVLLAQGGEFAFVVFGVARSARLLPGDWDALLTLTVALSMALTPLLLLAHDRLAARARSREERADDEVDEHGAPVLIAGFGRFGQIVGRLLFASGIKATVLDHDPDQIETLKRFGFRVYYGDATRIDLLRASGAGEARLLINAIDDPAASVALVDSVREAFPGLAILARARNVTHYYELRQRGVEVIERETFESALLVGRRALECLGVGPYEARERADRFRRHNVESMEALREALQDEERRTSLA